MSSASEGTVACPFCESEIGEAAKKCRFCGEWVARNCENCGTPLRNQWAARGRCAECSRTPNPAVARPPSQPVVTGSRSRVGAALFALLLGGFGIHKFYLGRIGQGIVYLLFCWTFIPALIAVIEGIIYLVMSEEDFHRKYG